MKVVLNLYFNYTTNYQEQWNNTIYVYRNKK